MARGLKRKLTTELFFSSDHRPDNRQRKDGTFEMLDFSGLTWPQVSVDSLVPAAPVEDHLLPLT